MSACLDIAAASVLRGAGRVLDSVTFSAQAGECVALAGPNGAGKTSLLRLLAGIEAPSGGSVRLDGADVCGLKPADRARRIAFLPQMRPLYAAIDVEALVALGRFAHGATSKLDGAGRAAVDRAMAATGISAFKARTATTLSGGELARAHLARALAAETPILIADEPVAALDPAHQLRVMRLLRQRAQAGGLVIAALHEFALARRFCTRIILLKAGRIVADGPPDSALAEARALYDLEPADARLLWGA